QRWRGCVVAVLLTGLTAGLLVLTGQSEGPEPGREPVKGRAPQQAVFRGEPHPLDPLSQEEMAATVRGLQDEKKFGEDSRLALLALHEPPKKEVLAWEPGQPIRREAFAVVLDRKANQTFEAVVDLGAQKTVSWKPVVGVQPNLLLDEYDDIPELVLAD